MADSFMGEIRMIAFNYPPQGWAFCDGQLLPVSQNPGLFSLLGTTYGGDGISTFALPDFRSRGPIHMGQGNGLSDRTLGEKSGQEETFLVPLTAEVPRQPSNPTVINYTKGYPAPVNNMQPYLVVGFIINLNGAFPKP